MKSRFTMSLFRCGLPVVLACYGLFHKAEAVSPPPDGGYPGGNTAEGDNALLGLTTGLYNAAIGYAALQSNIGGSFNTGIGAGALLLNTGDHNTATGAGALLYNTTGAFNTANGAFALLNNSNGSPNSAFGWSALRANTGGNYNTAAGYAALYSNTSGSRNTAVGDSALLINDTGGTNTAIGVSALRNNSAGMDNVAVGNDALVSNNANDNTAVGYQALLTNSTGDYNVAVGAGSLFNHTAGASNVAVGNGALYHDTYGTENTAFGFQALFSVNNVADNTAIGYKAGRDITGEGNVCIGADIFGVSGVDETTWIANIFSSVATGRPVYVNQDGKMGTLSSSRRYKEQIRPMDSTSETLFALRPVIFRYKKEIDAHQTLSFGLIAEDVAQIDPALVTLDNRGQPQTVRYDAVNAMLLNEFLKEHRKVEEQTCEIQEQNAIIKKLTKGQQLLAAQLKAQAAAIEKVNAELQIKKPGPRIVRSETD